MHPILAYRERILLYLVAWLIISGLIATLMVFTGNLGWGDALLLTIPMGMVYAFVCLASLYLCRSFPLSSTEFVRVLAVSVIASFLSASVWTLLGGGWTLLLARFELNDRLTKQFNGYVPLLLAVGTLLFALAIVVHYLILAFDASRTAERQLLEVSVLAKEAEIRALKAQVRPHFLFNSLNSISALTTSDPAMARTMAIRLAEFLRTTLTLESMEHITLAKELELIENYLAIEQVRFGPRLNFEKHIEPSLTQTLVPPMMLQPLVENAITHGIAHIVDGGTISLKATRVGDAVRMTLTNPIDADFRSSKRTGVGLENVTRRLQAMFDGRSSVLTEKNNSGFTLTLVFPFKNTATR